MVIELGAVASSRSPVPETLAPTATVRLWGVFPTGCMVRGRVVGSDSEGTPVYEYLEDPNFRTAFCRNAVTEYGLQPLLRMNNISF